MNHAFVKPAGSEDKCVKCRFPEISHGDKAVCETCPNVGPVEIRFGNMLMCEECWRKEQKTHAENITPEKQQERVDLINQRVAKNNTQVIEMRTDLFNQATEAIVVVKNRIEVDNTIENKKYALAEYLKNHHSQLQSKIFDAQKQIDEMATEQRAVQVYLNNMANQLRKEEREKLKIADINYKPVEVKSVKPREIKTKKVPQKDIKAAALKHQLPEFILTQMVLQGSSLDEAVAKVQKAISTAKAKS